MRKKSVSRGVGGGKEEKFCGRWAIRAAAAVRCCTDKSMCDLYSSLLCITTDTFLYIMTLHPS